MDEFDDVGVDFRASSGKSGTNGDAGEAEWPEPQPLPSELLPVKAFDARYLPANIAPWASDIAERLQCSLDFVGVPAIVALGAVIGRRIGIKPQRESDWIEVPNMWGCIVGRPGTMKSPATQQALKPLNRLEMEAQRNNERAQKEHEGEVEAHKLKKDAARFRARKGVTDFGDAVGAEPEEPLRKRYVTSDTTYEALGVIMAANPNGVLTYRDELVSLLKPLDREENSAARGFFLSAWNGTSGYTFDRIIRGCTHIDAACLSLLGSTQPGRLSEYISRAVKGGAGDDGLMQRFGLLVWPDQSPDWREVDRYPDSAARQKALETYERLDKLTADDVGAERDQFEAVPFLRFDGSALGRFRDWRGGLELRLRTGELHPALEAHFSKYRKLVPSLCLINHLADGGVGPISETATLRALALVDYLESHARRCYASVSQVESATAKAIWAHIRKGDLRDGFSSRDVWRPEWSGLTDRDAVQSGLNLLVDYDWLAVRSVPTPGRTKTIYRVNPRALQ